MKRKARFDDIVQIGWLFNMEFFLPPFGNNIDECFFDIDEFKETSDFQTFIDLIGETKVPYEYAKAKGSNKIFLTIKISDMEGINNA